MPSGLEEFWDPNEWELFVFGLLQDRHGPLNVTKVPARHQGDHGLDYYCLAEAVVYQCYAVEEPCDVAARATNQKVKITKDLKKFSSDSPPLRRIFQSVQVRRWVLVVPLHDSSSVNQHLSEKTATVRALPLGYVAPDFEATIQDLAAFPVGSKEIRLRQMSELTLPTRTPSSLDVETWSESQNELVENLARKLKKRFGATGTADLNRAIGWFLECENILEDLRDSAPTLHELIRQAIKRLTTRLEFVGPPDGRPEAVLRGAIEELEATLRSEVPNLSADSAAKMALGTVADWLLRCPLDYPPYENAS